ncbi:hypothetical protein CRUP_034463 [Coryphaenoides rupestris]|nr:hypothetical protein CRUP_034463 [Coryphaenoides rupestris]
MRCSNKVQHQIILLSRRSAGDQPESSVDLRLLGLGEQAGHHPAGQQQRRHQQEWHGAGAVHKAAENYVSHDGRHSSTPVKKPQSGGPERSQADSRRAMATAEAPYRSWVGYSSVPTTSREFQLITDTPLKRQDKDRLPVLVWTT